MFIELHILQNFAPANLNRDDTNQPKDAEFGGWRRARISSQALKRAIRWEPIFTDTIAVPLATRSHWIVKELSQRCVAGGKPADEVERVVTDFAKAYSSKKNKMDKNDPQRTTVALFMAEEEFAWVTASLLAQWPELLAAPEPAKKATRKKSTEEEGEEEVGKLAPAMKAIVEELIKQTKGRTSAPDIALFGRMLADRPETNIDAACQVAHAISTHAIRMDADFFTAVDDLQPKEATGASMMGTVGFNSACMYRYARLDFAKLVANLNGDKELALKTVKGFLLAAEAAIPSGKQNSFAAHNRPALLLGVVRGAKSTGWSLANAFETPVRPQNGSGLVQPSAKALSHYWEGLCAFYGTASVAEKAVAVEPALAETLSADLQAARQPTLEAWAKTLVEALAKAEGA